MQLWHISLDETIHLEINASFFNFRTSNISFFDTVDISLLNPRIHNNRNNLTNRRTNRGADQIVGIFLHSPGNERDKDKEHERRK